MLSFCSIKMNWLIKNRCVNTNRIICSQYKQWYGADILDICFISPYLKCKRPESEQWNLFRGLTAECVASFYLHCTDSHYCAHTGPPWQRPLMVWKCFYFIWRSGSGLVWQAERPTVSYLDSRTHNVVIFFARGKLLLQFIFSPPPVYQCNAPHLQAGRILRCISVYVCVNTCGTAPGFTD